MPGEAIRVGATVLMVRGRTARLQLRRLWSASEFAGLVEDECLRAHRRPSAVFAVAHLDLEEADDQGPGGEVSQAGLADLLTRVDAALPPPHLLGAASGSGLEALLVAVPPSVMNASLRRLVRTLRAGGYRVRLGASWYPLDGRTPAVLRGAARRRAGAMVTPEPTTAGPLLAVSAPDRIGLDFLRESAV